MVRLCGALIVILALTACGGARSVQVQPQAVEDAQVGVRVKTALVNDPQLGPRVIEVRVTRGLVILTGQVNSDEEAARALEVARAVPGVNDVRSQLVVRQESAVEATLDPASLDPVRPVEPPSSASRRRLLAVGASLNARRIADGSLTSALSPALLFRLGSGNGLGLTMGLNWFRSDLELGASADSLGRITVRPVMAGVSYTFTDQNRWSISPSLVGGVAFNSFTLGESTSLDVLALEIANSLVLRPGVSLWVDLNSRVAVNVFTGYMITRPEMTFLEDGQFTQRTVRADAAILNVGLAYKIF